MPGSAALSLVSSGIFARHHSSQHLSTPGFIAFILEHEVDRNLHKLTPCGE